MYPFLTMNDHAEIVYSHLLDDGRVRFMLKSRMSMMVSIMQYVFFPAAAGRISSVLVTRKFRNTKR